MEQAVTPRLVRLHLTVVVAVSSWRGRRFVGETVNDLSYTSCQSHSEYGQIGILRFKPQN
jgi:hypothetical protein